MNGLEVELRGAKIRWIGWFAHHYFFVVKRQQQGQWIEDRWEVWQRPEQCEQARGHLHKNLLPAYAGVGWGTSWCEASWVGVAAVELRQRIEGQQYDACYQYRYWPGPNSNTYVQRTLGDLYRLPWQAIGRSY